nr:nuclear transport factor 2 family protein [Pseudomonas sp.]
MFSSAEEAEAAFYEALELGDVELLMRVWSSDEAIACIHPGGDRLTGVDAVRASWQEILANGALPLRRMGVHTVHSAMSSVHTVIEQLAVSTRQGRHVVNCYATNVYHSGPSGWRLVLHHASQAPDDSDVATHHDVPGILH